MRPSDLRCLLAPLVAPDIQGSAGQVLAHVSIVIRVVIRRLIALIEGVKRRTGRQGQGKEDEGA